MAAALIDIEALPRRDSTDVKNKWGSVVRHVRSVGRIAITNRKEIDLVVMSAQEYNDVMQKVKMADEAMSGIISKLSKEFDERLSVLQKEDAAQKIEDFFDADRPSSVVVTSGVDF